MKLNEIKKLKSDKSLIKKLVHESNFSLLNIKDTYINNLYTEYAVDVKMEDNDINDKQFTQTEKAKHFRE